MVFNIHTSHIESSFQIEDAFHGIAILSLSIAIGYLYMYSGYFFQQSCVSSGVPGLSSSLYPWQIIFINVDIIERELFF